ncbi:MAG: HAD family hydrolase [Chloroflexota bacterium]
MLRHLPPDAFAAVIDADRVRHAKPHPEAYLAAAAALGVDPAACVAIEDSEPGVVSAVAAGCTVIVVPNRVPIAAGLRRVQVPSLAGLTPERLAALAAEAPRA